MFTVKRGELYELACLRGFAAIYVVFYHVSFWLNWQGPLRFVASFGQEAVMLFFVLSGFVIHFVSDRRGMDGFWRARLLRIYPIFLVTLLFAYGCACIIAGGFIDPQLEQLVGNLLMLQDRPRTGSLIEPYMGNMPLWSLSYEWIFYIIYWLIMQLAAERKTMVALVLSAGCFLAFVFTMLPITRFGSYFMLWWLGVALCEGYRGRGWGALAATASVVGIGVATIAVAQLLGKTSGEIEFLGLRHFAAALLAVFLIMGWSRLGWRGFTPLLGAFGVLAPISYAVYLLHYPLLRLAPMTALPLPAGITMMVLISMAVAWVLEVPVQTALNNRLRPKRPALP